MAKRGTRGYKAQRLREMGERRIKRLESAKTADLSDRTKNWVNAQIREIKSAIQGTRQYSKSGKRYKSKSTSYIDKQIERLETAVKAVPQRYTYEGDSFAVTQRELNRASVKAPSIYTKQEVQLFYRATQKIWQVEGVGEHRRNEAILDYYNSIREQNGLTPLRLDEIVDYVLNANQEVQAQLAVNPFDDMDEREQQDYAEAQKNDNADGDAGSPPGIGEKVIQDIRDALDDLFVVDFKELETE